MQMYAICFTSAVSMTVLRSGSLFLGSESCFLGCSAEGGCMPSFPYAAIRAPCLLPSIHGDSSSLPVPAAAGDRGACADSVRG